MVAAMVEEEQEKVKILPVQYIHQAVAFNFVVSPTSTG